MSSRRLRRDEPPNPTPTKVRAIRSDCLAMDALGRGVSAEAIASQFGYRSPRAATSSIKRTRNAAFPFDIDVSIGVERQTVNVLASAVMRSVYPGAKDLRLLPAMDLVLDSVRLELRFREAADAWRRAQHEPTFAELWDVDLGEWTDPLAKRADGWSFHDIADDLGFADFFDANELVASQLVHYHQGCAARLRARQVAHLDAELREVWQPATRARMVDLRAARRAMLILTRRCDVRGIGLPFTGPMIDHSPEVHR